jgi:hypothetical protein
MMDAPERHHELVARLATQDPRLQVAQVDGSRMACGHRGGKAVGQRSEGMPCCDNGGGGNRWRAFVDGHRLISIGIARAF